MVSIDLESLVNPFYMAKKEFKQQLEKAKPYILSFCIQYKARLTGIVVSCEEGKSEPGYVFNDDLGVYTLEGIKKSLEGIEWRMN